MGAWRAAQNFEFSISHELINGQPKKGTSPHSVEYAACEGSRNGMSGLLDEA